jgi:hypothetical protein
MPISVTSKVHKSKSVSKPKQKSPNEDPENHFTLVDNLKTELSDTCFAFDISGSQQDRNNQGKSGKTLIQLMRSSCDIKNVRIYPFGEDKLIKTINSIESFTKKFTTISDFDHGETSTKSLNYMLSNAVINKHNRIVILGDGTFRSRNNSFQEESKLFLQHLKTCDFSSIQELVLLFSPLTAQSTVDNLSRDVSNILGKCQNAIIFTTWKIPNINGSHDNSTLLKFKNFIIGNTKQIPEQNILVGDLFCFHKDMTYITLSNLLRNKDKQFMENEITMELLETNKNSIVCKLFTFMKSIIFTKPEFLLDTNSIYGKLHNVLKLLLKHTYMDWISLTKNSSSGTVKSGLDSLINEAYNKEAEYLQLIEDIGDHVIGYLQFPSLSISKNDILDVIKDGSCSKLIIYLNKNISNCKFIGKKKGIPITNHGMLVIKPPGTKEDINKYKIIARKSLQTLFYQFGNFLLEGNRVFITGLKILSSSDLDIEKFIYDSIKSAVFNDPEYSFKMLGFDSKTESLEIPDLIWNPPIMRLISQCAISFPIELFGESTNQKEELIGILSSFLKVQNIVKAYKNFSYKLHTYKYESISSVSNEIEIGDIVTIKSWTGEIQPNLPAVAILRRIKNKKGIAKYKIEYLDRKISIGDTFELEKKHLSLLKKCPTQGLVEILNNFLIYLQVNGENGKLGEEMTLTANRTTLRKINDSILSDMIVSHQSTNSLFEEIKMKKHNINDFKYFIIQKIIKSDLQRLLIYWKSNIKSNLKKVDVFVDLPKSSLLKILKHRFGINENLENMLKHNTSFNKDTHMICSSTDPMFNETNPLNTLKFVDKGEEYTLNEDNINEIFFEFKKELDNTKISGCLVSNIRECSLCYTEQNKKKFHHFNGCNHPICFDCKDNFDTLSKYKPGDFVKEYYHKCVTCRNLYCEDQRISDVFNKYNGSLPQNLKVRFCSDICCDNLFEFNLTCGGSEEDVPLLCEEHRLIDITAKKCPVCNTFVSKTEGCDHMNCFCGSHWCWGCQHLFSADMIPLLDDIWWKCDGQCSSQTELKYIDNSEEFMW